MTCEGVRLTFCGHLFLTVCCTFTTGLWEFPSVMLEDSAPAARGVRRSKINDYLRETLELFPDQ